MTIRAPSSSEGVALGAGAPAFEGPAVTGGHRAIGSLLVVDPAWSVAPPTAVALGGDAALMPLSGPAALVSALCPDALALRRALDTGLALLVEPAAEPADATGALASVPLLIPQRLPRPV